jgi:hypothetical protein
MRLNSGKSAKWLKLVYLLTIFSLIFDLVILNVDGSLSGVSKLSPVGIAVLLFLWYRGPSEFLYDSDGEVLNLTAQEPNLKWLSKRVFYSHTEFPKRKLAGFKIKRYPFRRTLILNINSKAGSVKKEKFTISYLKRNELADLSRSLRNVVDQNKNKHE